MFCRWFFKESELKIKVSFEFVLWMYFFKEDIIRKSVFCKCLCEKDVFYESVFWKCLYEKDGLYESVFWKYLFEKSVLYISK